MSGEAVLLAEGLCRRFGDQVAVDDLSLDVAEGEIHALVGLNGAGKTTLMRLLLGMLDPDAGRACIDGHDVRRAPAALWAGVGHLIETPFAYPELTVVENLTASARLHGLDRAAAGEAARATVAELVLGRWAERPARVLSLGNRQRLGLACAVVHRPHLLVLDEPTSALDPAGVVAVRTLLRRLAVEEGAAVLVSKPPPRRGRSHRRPHQRRARRPDRRDHRPRRHRPRTAVLRPRLRPRRRRERGLMRSALAIEWLKVRRARTMWTATAVLVGFTPLLSAAFMAASGAAGGELNDSQLAAKVGGLLVGTGWEGYLGLIAQTASVASLLVVGFATAWSVGREFADRTIGSLMALPVRPGSIAAAKLTVLAGWAVACAVAGVALAVAAGLVIGLGAPDAGVVAGVGRILAVQLLGTALAAPIAVVATAGRGHLPAVAALVGVIVVTQIVTTVGAGGWFPYAAPSLWVGMGGAEAAAAITATQLLLPVGVGAAGVWATVAAWDRVQLS